MWGRYGTMSLAIISENLPVLAIVALILGAAITPILGRKNSNISWLITLLSTLIFFIISLFILKKVFDTGGFSYWFGNWEPPYGIAYVYDPLSAFVLVLLAFLAFSIAIYAKNSLEFEIEEHRITLFYTMYLLFIAGLAGIISTGDLFNLYVFLEIASIASYTLIAVGRRRESLMASFTYLVLGSIAASFIVLGIGYLYMATGTLNMADMAARLEPIYESKLVLIAFAFLIVGLSIKIALFPLHNWLPNAYAYAPSVTSTIMAAIATKVSAYVLIRVMFNVFKPEFEVTVVHVTQILIFLSVLAIITGSLLALSQTDIKKVLAYSSIGQVGYITLGIALMNETAMTGSIIHILNHALMKSCLFMVVGIIVYKTGITHTDKFTGLGKKLPLTMAAFTVAAVSMIGVPLTTGFVSKWYLAMGSLEAGMGFLIPVIMLSSLMTVIYFWRVIDNIWFKVPKDEIKTNENSSVPALMLVPTLIMAVLCIFFGVAAYLPLGIAEHAAAVLLQ